MRVFYIPYDMSQENYTNFLGEFFVRDSDTVDNLRSQIGSKFEINPGSFIVTAVTDSYFSKMFPVNSKLEEVLSIKGTVILYEVKPELNPHIPGALKVNKFDSNYGINE